MYKTGTPCYAFCFGPRGEKDPRWVPAVVTKVFGARSVNVQVYPKGPTWRRHIDQLRPRYGIEEDDDPGEVPKLSSTVIDDTLVLENITEIEDTISNENTTNQQPGKVETHIQQGTNTLRRRRPRTQISFGYSLVNPRRSNRQMKSSH